MLAANEETWPLGYSGFTFCTGSSVSFYESSWIFARFSWFAHIFSSQQAVREGRRAQDLQRRAEEDTQRLRGLRATTETGLNMAQDEVLRQAGRQTDDSNAW